MIASPGRPVFLTAEWRHLVMLNFEVPATLLQPLVPRGTVLDLWHGHALVSVVGFRFLGTSVLGIPVPFHRNFDEVNLRFYVRREMPDGEVRRGVTFIRELVPRRAIAWVARLAYNEPYQAVPMRSETPESPPAPPGTFRYSWRRRTPAGRHWESVEAQALGPSTPAERDSECEFITEHYWGYTTQRDGGTVEYEVRHPPWRVHAAVAPKLRAHVASLYGQPFAEPLATEPRSAFVADGSAVSVYKPRRLDR